jgi:uncharacterized protein (DUF427 family)
MAKASWNGAVLAQSDTFEVVEGNIYFPIDTLNMDYFQQSTRTSLCPWKGTANYYDIVVNGQTNKDAAWVYRTPKPAADKIKDYIAFWGGVTVEG